MNNKNAKRTPSIQSMGEKSQKAIKERHKQQQYLQKCNQIISWVCGVILSLIPFFSCGILCIIHLDNEELRQKYSSFMFDFITNGSFLWVSITVLGMSLIDLILRGMKKEFFRPKIFTFVIVSVFLLFVGVMIFMNNIGNPINKYIMIAISILCCILYTVSSGIVSFKLAKN